MKQCLLRAGAAAFFLAFFFFTAFNAAALGKKENNAAQSKTEVENTTTITGRIQIYGNEPHTFVGIVDQQGVAYSIHPPHQEAELRKLQGQLIEFTVLVLDEPQDYAGMVLGKTLTLIDWKVIKP
jgi:predicted membrane metal-binding protein